MLECAANRLGYETLRDADAKGIDIPTATVYLDEQRAIRSEALKSTALRPRLQNIFEAVDTLRAGGPGLEAVNGLSRRQNILKIQHRIRRPDRK